MVLKGFLAGSIKGVAFRVIAQRTSEGDLGGFRGLEFRACGLQGSVRVSTRVPWGF